LGCEPPRLLIVDDNPANLEIMEARLARQGYEIVTATDGDTALGAARERRQT
jgi:CheY-like chemotaxis protein